MPHFSGYIAYRYPEKNPPKIGRDYGTPLNCIQDTVGLNKDSVGIVEAAVVPQSLYSQLLKQLKSEPQVEILKQRPCETPDDQQSLQRWMRPLCQNSEMISK
jgi:hypothetical protein